MMLMTTDFARPPRQEEKGAYRYKSYPERLEWFFDKCDQQMAKQGYVPDGVALTYATGVPKTTCYRWLDKWKQARRLDRKPRSVSEREIGQCGAGERRG